MFVKMEDACLRQACCEHELGRRGRSDEHGYTIQWWATGQALRLLASHAHARMGRCVLRQHWTGWACVTLRISRSWCSHVLSNVVGARGSPLALVAFLEQAILRRARGLGRVAFRAWLTAVEQAVEERQEVACRQGWGVRSEAIIAYRQRGDIRGRCGEVLAMWREAARGQRWATSSRVR